MKRTLTTTAACLSILLGANSLRAATIEITFTGDPGVGFFDATFRVFAPNNNSFTLGGQRQNVVRAAAAYWENALGGDETIRIELSMSELGPCNASGGLLGYAGPVTGFRDFAGAPVSDVYYAVAVANNLAGTDLDPGISDITGEFNTLVDGDDVCFTSSEWWYGIGEPAPAGKFDFYRVVLHEIGHGLGFATWVDPTVGTKPNGYDDAYMRNLEDHSTGKTWSQMTNAERVASAKDTGDLHWIGPVASGLASLASAGVGAGGHLTMYAPNPVELGSSVAHWAKEVSPNEVMEPVLNNDAGDYLTLGLLRDIGWQVRLVFVDDFERGNLNAWIVP